MVSLGLNELTYHQISNIRRTKSQTLNVSCLVLQLSLPKALESGVKSRMKMYIVVGAAPAGDAPTTSEWVINNFIAYYGAPYIRGYTVV